MNTTKIGADGMTRTERKAHIQRIRDERRGGLTVKAYNALHGILTKKEQKAANAAHDEHLKQLALAPVKPQDAAENWNGIAPTDRVRHAQPVGAARPRLMRRMVLRTSKGWQPVIVYTSGGWDKTLAGVRIDLATR